VATKTHTSTLYYIATDALNVTENIDNDPRRILVTLKAGSIIKVYSSQVSFFNTAYDGSFKSWPLVAYNTYLDGDCWYDSDGNVSPRTIYMYARIRESGGTAEIIFTNITPSIYALVGICDTEGNVTNATIHHVHLGTMTYDTDGGTYSLTWDSGDLGTDHNIQTSSGDMFEIVTENSVNYIRQLLDFVHIKVRDYIQLAGQTIYKFLVSSDDTTDTNFNDTSAVTSSWLKNVIDTMLLRKDQDDSTTHKLTMGEAEVTGDATVGGDLTVGENTTLGGNVYFGSSSFVLDSSGNGYDATNNVLQVENLKILGKMEAKEVEIQEVNYIGGTQVLTPANGFKIIKVEWVDDSFEVTTDASNRDGYKIYFDNTDEDGLQVKNFWQYGDLAYCQQWGIRTGTTENFSNHLWWRKVINNPALDDDFIIVSSLTTEAYKNSDAPAVGDKVVMLGSLTDTSRQTAIIQSASQSGAPYIRLYKGVPVLSASTVYALPEPFINLSSERTLINADEINIGSRSVESGLSKLDDSFEVYQVDWDDDPTTEMEPAKDWFSAGTAAEHVGDFLILSDGRCYKFVASGGTYTWSIVTDEYLIKFVDQISTKSTIFNLGPNAGPTEMPIGYKVNDLWVNVNYSNGSVTYEDEILIAQNDYVAETASINDWTTTNKYQENVSAYLNEIQQIVAKYGVITGDSISTYYVDSYSTLTTYKNTWLESEETSMEHLGDQAYVSDQESDITLADTLYEWTRTGSDEDGWVYDWAVSSNEILKTMIITAHDAQLAADGKITAYIYQTGVYPSDYNLGDLWTGVDGTFQYTDDNGDLQSVTYQEETLVCIAEQGTSSYHGDIRDWARIGDYPTSKDLTALETRIASGYVSIDGWASMYAEAVCGDETVSLADIGVLVEKNASNQWVSTAYIEADNIILSGQTTFVSNLASSSYLDLQALAHKSSVAKSDLEAALRTELDSKTEAQTIYNAMVNGSTEIIGGYINTDLLDVGTILGDDAIFSGTLNAARGTFSGELQAASGEFDGVVRATAYYHTFYDGNGGQLDPTSDSGTTIKTAGSYILPNAATYEGIEYTFIIPSRALATITVTTYSSSQYIQGDGVYSNSISITANGIPVRLVAISGNWYIFYGESAIDV